MISKKDLASCQLQLDLNVFLPLAKTMGQFSENNFAYRADQRALCYLGQSYSPFNTLGKHKRLVKATI
jgi:hypothetical protein